MPATASASTAKSSRARASQRSQAVRQSQRHWVQLIEAWRSASRAADARDTLVDEIAHHAQTICRTVKDKQWLVTAFNMAIHAVLLDDSEDALEAKELLRREQLGQQLLQLATHSVGAPWISSLKGQHADERLIASAEEALGRFEQLANRLTMFQRLHALADKMALPVLPLGLVLEESTNGVLLCIASIPRGAEMVAQLLKSCAWLVEESAPVRLTIAAQMLAAAPPSEEAYAALAKHGMLIAWKNGREESAWQAPASKAPAVSLGEWAEFYAKALAMMRSDSEADVLLDVLARQCEGRDVHDAIARLRSQLASKPSVALPGNGEQQGTPAGGGKETARFSLDAVKALSAQVSLAARNKDATAAAAQQLVAECDVGGVSQRLTALIDSNDGVDTRAFAIEVIAQAARASASPGLARVAAATLYARPAVGGFRLDLDAPASLVKAAEVVLAQLAGQAHVSTTSQSRLARSLRGALALDAQSVVPACQVLALVSSEESDEELAKSMQMHVRWLRTIGALLAGQGDKPALDLCWLAAYGGERRDSAGREDHEAQTQQLVALDSLMDAFGTANAPPSSLGGRPERAGADAGLLRFRAAWDGFFHSTLDLCGAESALALVSRDKAMRLLLGQVLSTGDVDLFTSLSTGPNALGGEEREQLVLDVSSSLFDQATIASTRSKDVRLALGVLDALPASPRATAQREFIDAACRLGSFKLKSIRHAGGLLEPVEMRMTTDKMDLVARLVASQEGVHRSPELVLDLAHRLCGLDTVAAGKGMVEVRVLAMLADAATAAEDFDAAAAFCQRLVHKAQRPRSGAEVEVVWKSCLQLSKHPMWTDTAGRIDMLAHAMALCPPTQLSAMLRQWNALDQQLATEIDEGRAVAKKDGARTGGMNAGLVGTAANLLPLSFSPLSYFGGASTAGPKATREDGVDARTARLFDFDAVSGAAEGGSGYVDPAERAVNAARAARDFLGWKKSAPHDNGAGGGFAGFSLSRGVGWLIGDADKR
ncbi:uncharacterized protein PAN0_003c1612 [Moesziomyces antarcticus]|uniref:Sec39 domain-containing protein n=1 Tax=Pseudozyma antarctica TaxID=84753 RepID=A0A5C3FHY9_PSEA2|nr:uncharacterized protein PAN0_003c1612 [Moesziomyces antarcticus]GAK63408.1 conserved hypothetical protein [Moesziomyces antarcticus]SPO43992.1 uncharacterized protein PSANT_01677 [Moesziomyces antarcticus]